MVIFRRSSECHSASVAASFAPVGVVMQGADTHLERWRSPGGAGSRARGAARRRAGDMASHAAATEAARAADGAAEAADSKSSAGDVAGAAAAGEDDTAGGVVDGNKDAVDSAGLGLAAAGVEAPKGAGAVFSKDLGVLGKYRILVQAKRA